MGENWHFSRGLTFGPYQELFHERVGRHPDRIKNLHFVFAFMMRALHTIKPHIDRLLESGANSCFTCAETHNSTRTLLLQLLDPPQGAAGAADCRGVLQAFDNAVLFSGQDAEASRLLYKDIARRFRHMGNLMTCVGCDRCKLWGTLQFHAARVALGILLKDSIAEASAKTEDQFAVPRWTDLKPNDIVALVNALAQLSKSIDHVRHWMPSAESSHDEL